ncbi:unnamed protein product [Amoebophrya sp. A120]|nr:unnamed protein product [Amoebophrya sp. A120]|eukprot:GSA120T00006110001.1
MSRGGNGSTKKLHNGASTTTDRTTTAATLEGVHSASSNKRPSPSASARIQERFRFMLKYEDLDRDDEFLNCCDDDHVFGPSRCEAPLGKMKQLQQVEPGDNYSRACEANGDSAVISRSALSPRSLKQLEKKNAFYNPCSEMCDNEQHADDVRGGPEAVPGTATSSCITTKAPTRSANGSVYPEQAQLEPHRRSSVSASDMMLACSSSRRSRGDATTAPGTGWTSSGERVISKSSRGQHKNSAGRNQQDDAHQGSVSPRKTRSSVVLPVFLGNNNENHNKIKKNYNGLVNHENHNHHAGRNMKNDFDVRDVDLQNSFNDEEHVEALDIQSVRKDTAASDADLLEDLDVQNQKSMIVASSTGGGRSCTTAKPVRSRRGYGNGSRRSSRSGDDEEVDHRGGDDNSDQYDSPRQGYTFLSCVGGGGRSRLFRSGARSSTTSPVKTSAGSPARSNKFYGSNLLRRAAASLSPPKFNGGRGANTDHKRGGSSCGQHEDELGDENHDANPDCGEDARSAEDKKKTTKIIGKNKKSYFSWSFSGMKSRSLLSPRGGENKRKMNTGVAGPETTRDYSTSFFRSPARAMRPPPSPEMVRSTTRADRLQVRVNDAEHHVQQDARRRCIDDGNQNKKHARNYFLQLPGRGGRASSSVSPGLGGRESFHSPAAEVDDYDEVEKENRSGAGALNLDPSQFVIIVEPPGSAAGLKGNKTAASGKNTMVEEHDAGTSTRNKNFYQNSNPVVQYNDGTPTYEHAPDVHEYLLQMNSNRNLDTSTRNDQRRRKRDRFKKCVSKVFCPGRGTTTGGEEFRNNHVEAVNCFRPMRS